MHNKLEYTNRCTKPVFDDFMISMPRLMRKTLSVLFMSYFQKRYKLSVNASVLDSAFITGFNEKTI